MVLRSREPVFVGLIVVVPFPSRPFHMFRAQFGTAGGSLRLLHLQLPEGSGSLVCGPGLGHHLSPERVALSSSTEGKP